MNKKVLLLICFVFIIQAGIFAESIFKVPEKDAEGKVIKGKWVTITNEDYKKYDSNKVDADMKAEEPAEMENKLTKQITTWTKKKTKYIETHIYDPRKKVAQEGYQPVDITYITIEKAE